MLIRFSPKKKQGEAAWQAGKFLLKFFKLLRQGVANTERERLNISALPPTFRIRYARTTPSLAAKT